MSYGKARSIPQFETATTFLARDEFNQSAGALTGKTAAAGGTWTVIASSDADDFAVESTGNTAQRTAVSDAVPRMVTIGTTAHGAIAGQVDLKADVITTFPIFGWQGGVLVRGVDIDDYVMAGTVSSRTTEQTVGVVISVAGNAVAHSIPYRLQAGAWYTARIVVDTGGRWHFWFHPRDAAASTPLLRGQQADLATGWALDDGKVGLYDGFFGSSVATIRSYDNAFFFTPTANATIFAGQSMEFRSYGEEAALREDSTGTYWGRPSEVRGGRVWLAPAGDEGRVNRIAVMARRTDIQTQPSEHISDSTSLTVISRPRWIVIPRGQ